MSHSFVAAHTVDAQLPAMPLVGEVPYQGLRVTGCGVIDETVLFSVKLGGEGQTTA